MKDVQRNSRNSSHTVRHTFALHCQTEWAHHFCLYKHKFYMIEFLVLMPMSSNILPHLATNIFLAASYRFRIEKHVTPRHLPTGCEAPHDRQGAVNCVMKAQALTVFHIILRLLNHRLRVSCRLSQFGVVFLKNHGHSCIYLPYWAGLGVSHSLSINSVTDSRNARCSKRWLTFIGANDTKTATSCTVLIHDDSRIF